MPELRRDPVIGRWVIIATERAGRPSDFQLQEDVTVEGFCPFCPGNEEKTPPEIAAYREANSVENGPGWRIRVVPNKHPALRIEGTLDERREGVFDRMNGIGAHEVIIESPIHDSSFCTLPRDHVRDILRVYKERIIELANDSRLRYVVVFKNRGRLAGASLQHSHSQLVALPVIPKRVYEERESCTSYRETRGGCVFCDVMKEELSLDVRVVDRNDSFVVLSPYASRFPFEVWILPIRHSALYETQDEETLGQLAEILSRTVERIDGTLHNPPYNLLLHNAPLRSEQTDCYHWHFELIPRLTRVAGFEWGSGFYINPVPPEDATRYLRESRLGS